MFYDIKAICNVFMYHLLYLLAINVYLCASISCLRFCRISLLDMWLYFIHFLYYFQDPARFVKMECHDVSVVAYFCINLNEASNSMKYDVIFDRVITALDCTLRVSSWSGSTAVQVSNKQPPISASRTHFNWSPFGQDGRHFADDFS